MGKRHKSDRLRTYQCARDAGDEATVVQVKAASEGEALRKARRRYGGGAGDWTVQLQDRVKKAKGRPTKKRRAKKKPPTTTAMQSRAQIFVPTDRSDYVGRYAVASKRGVETPWGFARVRGVGVTQSHRDLLDAILTYGEPRRTKNGNYHFYFTCADLRRAIGNRANDWPLIEKQLDEMHNTSIKVWSADGRRLAAFHVMDAYAVEKTERGEDKENWFSQWHCRVRVGAEFLRLYESDTTLDYPKLVPRIARLRYPLNKAIVRHVLSHGSFKGWRLDTLLSHVGSKDPRSRARRKILSELEALAGMGIEFTDADTFNYERPRDKVFVETPGGREKQQGGSTDDPTDTA